MRQKVPPVLYISTDVSEGLPSQLLSPEDGDSKVPCNVGACLSDYTAIHSGSLNQFFQSNTSWKSLVDASEAVVTGQPKCVMKSIINTYFIVSAVIITSDDNDTG
jgi:hypothetical protein